MKGGERYVGNVEMDGQDWTPVVVKKGSKTGASSRPPVDATTARLRKVEESDGPVKVKSISAQSRSELIQMRVIQKMNQAQLNVACAFPANTIKDIESGKMQPSPQQLNILNRTLKMALKYE